ncbi:FkbM family methyltransferase [Sphingomonas immobilis]|uniref:FkbM family methyltransferase n=1 Tax=Sphingomonas immobilis TaxID=3063997 RepID=A0ABT8ZUM9_9SPHN|nr:FkbM family methyltransferase [Sphingomonas sp. CA1-15]MDO7840917.1 FkbM family methyltransferase [Sphingomonas sp. CA1-15]
MSAVFRHAATLLRQPGLAVEYAGWLASKAATGGKPTRKMLGGIEIAGFSNFSEYHSVPRFINEDERAFLETTDFGTGPIIDIGANVGLVSLVLARRFPDRAIHAFEPNPTTFHALTDNVARNKAANVRCHQLAVSREDGTVLFDNDPINRGTTSIATPDSKFSTQVPAVALDSFVAAQGIASIGLLKVDVEGFETLVFGGARRVLEDIRPALIYFEVCPILTERVGFPAAGPAQTLADAGYDLFRIAERNRLYAATPADVASGFMLENWVAIPR